MFTVDRHSNRLVASTRTASATRPFLLVRLRRRLRCSPGFRHVTRGTQTPSSTRSVHHPHSRTTLTLLSPTPPVDIRYEQKISQNVVSLRLTVPVPVLPLPPVLSKYFNPQMSGRYGARIRSSLPVHLSHLSFPCRDLGTPFVSGPGGPHARTRRRIWSSTSFPPHLQEIDTGSKVT